MLTDPTRASGTSGMGDKFNNKTGSSAKYKSFIHYNCCRANSKGKGPMDTS
jgi:hypothetical protein